MTIYTEGARTAEFIVMEADGGFSRETVTVDATGAALEAGAVLGMVTVSGDYVAYDEGASDGSENVAGILYAGVEEDFAGDAVVLNDHALVDLTRLSYTGTEATVVAGLAAINIKTR